jgi:hypothetical protein
MQGRLQPTLPQQRWLERADAEGTAATTSRETGATAIADHSTPANGDLDHHPASKHRGLSQQIQPRSTPLPIHPQRSLELPPASTGSKDDKPAEIVPSTEVTVERVKSDAVEAEGTLALRDGTVQAAQATIDVNQTQCCGRCRATATARYSGWARRSALRPQ